jgi:hypothetical protein
MKLHLTFLILLIVIGMAQSQTHFKPVGDFTEAMTIALMDASVNGVNLVAGDEIGVFDGDLCVGVKVLEGDLGVTWDTKFTVIASGKSEKATPPYDGFREGNPIFFKLWDASEEVEIQNVVITYFNIKTGDEITPSPTFLFELESVGASLKATYNYAPIAKAGTDKELYEGDPGSLNGSASSDFEGLTLSYNWDDIDNIGLSATDVAQPTFTAPLVNVDTKFRVSLIVNDGEKDSKPDTVIVTVKQINYPPVAKAGADFEIAETELGKLDGSGSTDPDGLALTYSWTIEPDEIPLFTAGAAITDFTAPLVTENTEYKAILTVTNTLSLSDKDTVIIKVINFNLKPIAVAGPDQEVNEDVKVTLDGSASSDADNAPNASLTYKWTSVEGITINNSTTVSPDFTTPLYLKDSILQMVLVVNDGAIDSKPDTVLVKVKHKNLKPTANAGINFDVNENALGQLNGSGSGDLDGIITYQWTATGVTITGATLVNPTFTAPEVQADSLITFTLTVTDDKLDTDVDAVDVTIKHINKKPVANAGTDQEVDENVLISLDGSKSMDADKLDNITYKWVAPAGIILDNSISVTPKFTSPVIIEESLDYIFKLVVNDGKLDSDTDIVVVTVIHLNFAPVADAGADINIDENINGNLDGSKSSDFEGKPLTYNWTAPAAIVLSNPAIAQPSFVAPEVQRDTVYTVVLTVNDGVRTSLPDTIKIAVNHINKQPVANAGEDQEVDENVLVKLDGTASFDLDVYDAITYLWTSLNGIVLDDNTIGKPSFTTPWLMKDSIFNFSLVVNDGTVKSIADTVSVTVEHANLQPTANAGTDISIDEDTPGQLNGTGSTDPEGAVLTYLWKAPAGFIIDNPTEASPAFTSPVVDKNTTYEIELTVNDGNTENNTHTDKVIIVVYQVNKLPVANAGSDITVREQKPVMLDGSASYDPDALDTILFNWVAPVGITLDDPTSPNPLFIAPDVSEDKDYSFELTVTDKLKANIKSVNILSNNTDIVIVTVTANKAPVVNAGPTQNVRTNNLVTLHGEGSTDPDNDVLNFTWIAPAGIILTNPTSANPTFTAPDSNINKSYIFTLEVSDDLGLKDSKDVTINVISNLPPVIETESVVYVFEGDTVSLDASGSTDPDNDILIFEWFHGNADFINSVVLINMANPVLSFVAPQVESLTLMPIILRVNDGTEDSYQTVSVYVKDIINTVPIANAGADFDTDENVKGVLDGSASSDVEGNPITYLWTSEYLVLDDVTAIKPAFTAPEVTADTTVLITLVVNDGRLSSEPDTVLVTVKHVNKMPVAFAGYDIVVNEGDLITLDGSASTDADSDVITYTWNAIGFSITGAHLSNASAKAPEVQKDMKVPVELVVNDGKLNSIPDTVWVTVKQVNKAPVWVEVPTDVAFVGYKYLIEIKVSDPDLLDTIKITSNNLPIWLSLTDNGNGTAYLTTDSIPRIESLLGLYTFTLNATDGTVNIDKIVELTITIKTGIADLNLNSVKFYPNPTNGLLNVDFNSLPEIGTTIQVFNQLGHSVMLIKADSQTNQLNLSNNPYGLYYIKITNEKASLTGKIILR